MSATEELYRDLCRQIGLAHAALMKDIERIRDEKKDWSMADLYVRARWARYTLEVHELECHKLMLMRDLATLKMAEPIVVLRGN